MGKLKSSRLLENVWMNRDFSLKDWESLAQGNALGGMFDNRGFLGRCPRLRTLSPSD